jgi:Winged helix-turn helix
VIKLYAQGWEKISISRCLHVSRPTVDAWIKRFETEHFAGLLDKSSAPKAPARKVWLPLMMGVIALFPTMCSVRQWESTSHNVSLASGQHKWGWQEGTYLVK